MGIHPPPHTDRRTHHHCRARPAASRDARPLKPRERRRNRLPGPAHRRRDPARLADHRRLRRVRRDDDRPPLPPRNGRADRDQRTAPMRRHPIRSHRRRALHPRAQHARDPNPTRRLTRGTGHGLERCAVVPHEGKLLRYPDRIARLEAIPLEWQEINRPRAEAVLSDTSRCGSAMTSFPRPSTRPGRSASGCDSSITPPTAHSSPRMRSSSSSLGARVTRRTARRLLLRWSCRRTDDCTWRRSVSPRPAGVSRSPDGQQAAAAVKAKDSNRLGNLCCSWGPATALTRPSLSAAPRSKAVTISPSA